jgi:hypothetical protein
MHRSKNHTNAVLAGPRFRIGQVVRAEHGDERKPM